MIYWFQELHDEISGQKSKARDLISGGKRLQRESSIESDPVISEKLDHLKDIADKVGKQSADKLTVLEQVW